MDGKHRMNLELSLYLWSKVEMWADKFGVSNSAFVRHCIEDAVNPEHHLPLALEAEAMMAFEAAKGEYYNNIMEDKRE